MLERVVQEPSSLLGAIGGGLVGKSHADEDERSGRGKVPRAALGIL